MEHQQQPLRQKPQRQEALQAVANKPHYASQPERRPRPLGAWAAAAENNKPQLQPAVPFFACPLTSSAAGGAPT
jgi:hypothetical protein